MAIKNIPLKAKIRKTSNSYVVSIPISYLKNGLLKKDTTYNIIFTALETSPAKKKEPSIDTHQKDEKHTPNQAIPEKTGTHAST